MENPIEGARPAVLCGENMHFPIYLTNKSFTSSSHKRYGTLEKVAGFQSLGFKDSTGKFLESCPMPEGSGSLLLPPMFISKNKHSDGERLL
ncbi:MAG TPA: hypothetical protein PKO23_08635 [Candidatus Hydrogenedentes bacterium]|jgi:hypothetical protein|nr:hypothetical protein [Candidatus Hydrogenedentota bacterium]